jgi:hypothetical protein
MEAPFPRCFSAGTRFALYLFVRGERNDPMPEPTPSSPSSASSSAHDLPLAAGATLLTLVGYLEPAARIPAGTLVLMTPLLMLLGAVRRRHALAHPPGT